MNYELTVYQLGKILKSIDEEYNMKLLAKTKLSGGFVTLTGDVNIDYIPTAENSIKGNNIINLKVSCNTSSVVDIKLTGIKDCKFNVNLAPTHFKELRPTGLSLNRVKERSDECKLKIDDNLIFTIPSSVEAIEKLMKSSL